MNMGFKISGRKEPSAVWSRSSSENFCVIGYTYVEYDASILVEVGNGQGYIEFSVTGRFLFGSFGGFYSAVGSEVGILALTPVLQGNGKSDGAQQLPRVRGS